MYTPSVRLILKPNNVILVKNVKFCEDAFKKRGQTFEEKYIRNLTYEQLKKLKEHVKGERKKKIQDELNKRKNDENKHNKNQDESN